MAAIGRLDIARSLKRLFELTGTFSPALGEGIVPTAQLVDLEDTPFGPTVKWCITGNQASLVGEFSYLAILPGASLPENSWITIDEIWFHNTAARSYVIVPTLDTAAGISTLVEVEAVRSRRQPGFTNGTLWMTPEVRLLRGTNVAAPVETGLQWRGSADPSTVARVDISLSRGGALLVTPNAANNGVLASFVGRTHMTTAK